MTTIPPPPPPPQTGLYQIVSVLRGEQATSVNGLIRLPFQFVRLGLPDREWEIVERGDNVYQFSIKDRYPYSGVLDQKVIATIEPQQTELWHITYRFGDNAYTIEPVSEKEKAWTVAVEDSPESEIVIEKIRYVEPILIPPVVSATQLFRFLPANR